MSRSLVIVPVLAVFAGIVCGAARAEQAAPPTFTRDIVPILQGHCQACHRPNNVAPMSFLDYDEVRPWAKAIRDAVANRTMPPYHVQDAPIGHFERDLRLTDEQIETVLRWIDAGAVRGDPQDAPPPVKWSTSEWEGGQPDIIIEFPEFHTRPNKDEEVVFFSDYIFPEETWAQAFEFHVNDYRAVHHAGIFSADEGKMFIPPDRILNADDEYLDKFSAPGAGLELLGCDHLDTWLPGQRVVDRPKGSGFRIRPGQRMVMQAHFGPAEESYVVRPRIGLYLMDGTLDIDTGESVVMMTDLKVAAGDPNAIESRTIGIGAVDVVGFNVHMHLRGESSQIYFLYPDGRRKKMFDIAYNFDWQRIYWLEEPITVPEGTQVEFVAEWNNSADNLLNPDPTKDVVWGAHTTDEMYTGRVLFNTKRDRPRKIVDGVLVGARTD